VAIFIDRGAPRLKPAALSVKVRMGGKPQWQSDSELRGLVMVQTTATTPGFFHLATTLSSI